MDSAALLGYWKIRRLVWLNRFGDRWIKMMLFLRIFTNYTLRSSFSKWENCSSLNKFRLAICPVRIRAFQLNKIWPWKEVKRRLQLKRHPRTYLLKRIQIAIIEWIKSNKFINYFGQIRNISKLNSNQHRSINFMKYNLIILRIKAHTWI